MKSSYLFGSTTLVFTRLWLFLHTLVEITGILDIYIIYIPLVQWFYV